MGLCGNLAIFPNVYRTPKAVLRSFHKENFSDPSPPSINNDPYPPLPQPLPTVSATTDSYIYDLKRRCRVKSTKLYEDFSRTTINTIWLITSQGNKSSTSSHIQSTRVYGHCFKVKLSSSCCELITPRHLVQASYQTPSTISSYDAKKLVGLISLRQKKNDICVKSFVRHVL